MWVAIVYFRHNSHDYENPKLYLGKYANLAEIDYRIEQKKLHVFRYGVRKVMLLIKLTIKDLSFGTENFGHQM